jgi:hypothetical protein
MKNTSCNKHVHFFFFLQVIDRLPTLTKEIQRIGSDGAAFEPKPSSEISAQLFSDESDTKEKTLEDYPRPHSVIGVSVL